MDRRMVWTFALAAAALAWRAAASAAGFVQSGQQTLHMREQLVVLSSATYSSGLGCTFGYEVQQSTQPPFELASSVPLVIGSTITVRSYYSTGCGAGSPGFSFHVKGEGARFKR